jgi:hypothetical protein
LTTRNRSDPQQLCNVLHRCRIGRVEGANRRMQTGRTLPGLLGGKDDLRTLSPQLMDEIELYDRGQKARADMAGLK